MKVLVKDFVRASVKLPVTKAFSALVSRNSDGAKSRYGESFLPELLPELLAELARI